MAPKVIQLLDNWATNIIALEYNPEYREPISQSGSWGQKDFKGLLTIITQIREWALSKGINGYSIYPKEIMDERVRGNYCWRSYWEPKDNNFYHCSAHRKDCGLTKDKSLSEYERQIRHRDEVDCKIIQRIFQEKIEVSEDLLSKRKKLFERPWKLLGKYVDTRLKKNGDKQNIKKDPKGFMF